MLLMEDLPDDTMAEEWLAQAFDVAAVKLLKEQEPNDGSRARQRGSCKPAHDSR
jgi:hypothetical protein